MYLIIADYDDNFMPTGVAQKPTLVEATAAVETMKAEGSLNAFAVETEYAFADIDYIVVDPVAKDVAFNAAGLAADIASKAMAELRTQRDRLLAASDDRFLSDAPAGRGSQAWKDYRQALRDLPATIDDPGDPTWPEVPE